MEKFYTFVYRELIPRNHQLYFSIISQTTSKYHANDDDGDDNEDESQIIFAVNIANNVQNNTKRW